MLLIIFEDLSEQLASNFQASVATVLHRNLRYTGDVSNGTGKGRKYYFMSSWNNNIPKMVKLKNVLVFGRESDKISMDFSRMSLCLIWESNKHFC